MNAGHNDSCVPCACHCFGDWGGPWVGLPPGTCSRLLWHPVSRLSRPAFGGSHLREPANRRPASGSTVGSED